MAGYLSLLVFVVNRNAIRGAKDLNVFFPLSAVCSEEELGASISKSYICQPSSLACPHLLNGNQPKVDVFDIRLESYLSRGEASSFLSLIRVPHDLFGHNQF
jgi:hypothetical protein